MADNRDSVLTRSLKVAGEIVLVPGASLLIDGNVKSGLLHAGAGLLAWALFWQPAVLAIVANSLSTSLTGKGLLAHFTAPQDARKVPLQQRVSQDIERGLNLEEIHATVHEDVEDIYLETTLAHNRDG